ncbi:MAG: 16S rRNA (cytidine(1402)-2'-O)-methyltransferase [Thiobacillaceae bacterium]
MAGSEQPAQPGTLYVVATPIGNLRDIGLRALDVLRSVDRIAAEDTRVTQGLLATYGITRPLTALHEHNEATVTPRLIARLQAGESLALVSDAGTPGLSDPGAHLVRAARLAGVPVVPIPGPSAAATALSVAGISAPHWLFYGFLPSRAAARRRTLQDLAALPYHLVFYEAPHRILDCVADLAASLGPERELILARELTKRFEQVISLRLGEAQAWLKADAERQRGEFVLIVAGAQPGARAETSNARQVLATLLAELPASQAARLAARLTGLKRSALYALALDIKPEGEDQP